MKAIEPGDIVQLRSGGPMMTVQQLSVDSGPSADCCWFDSGGNLNKRVFSFVVLELCLTERDGVVKTLRQLYDERLEKVQ